MCKLIKFMLCLLLCVSTLVMALEDRENMCGIRKISRTPKIINGKEAYHGQFPWAVSIRLNRRHHCGGALINHNWILTAAHCVSQINSRSFTIKLGGHYRNTETESSSIEIPASKTVPHESFSFSSFANDIALIRLSKSVEYNNYISPICLPQSDGTDYYNTTGTVIGWGKITANGVSATSLQQVELPIIDNPRCMKWYESQGKVIPIRSSQFCAGLEEGGKDACQGDSGSPMMKIDQINGQAMAIGIVSAGIGCALPKLPGLYTKVSAYLPWITKQLTPDTTHATSNTTAQPPVSTTTWPTFPTTKPTVPSTKPTIPSTKPTIPSLKPILITSKPTISTTRIPFPTFPTVKPSTPDTNKIFTHSYPVWTIPASNHTIVLNLTAIFNQTHHNLFNPSTSTANPILLSTTWSTNHTKNV